MKYLLIRKYYPFINQYCFDLVIKLTKSQAEKHKAFINGCFWISEPHIQFLDYNRYNFNHKYGIKTFNDFHLLHGWFDNSELSAKDVKAMKTKNDIILPIDKNIYKNINKLINKMDNQNTVTNY